MSTSRTELKDLGEFKLIENITQNFKLHHTTSIHGIGDDAAVIDTGNFYILVKIGTELKDLGEFKLIENITQNFKLHHTTSIHGIGDDAAVIDTGNFYILV